MLGNIMFESKLARLFYLHRTKYYAKRWLLLFKEQKNIPKVVARNKPKIFVIGFNKTATTSIKHALAELDIIVGNQTMGEYLAEDMLDKRYKTLLQYCETAEAFQDVPFSFPNVYKLLDKKFPGSKFILSVRDSSEQWFNSILKFHGKHWANNGVPTRKDLENANYLYRGYAYVVNQYIYGDHYYEKEHYIKVYEDHIHDVKTWFKDRPDDLLVLNVAEEAAYFKFCDFIGKTPLRKEFPWENRTIDLPN